MAQYVHTAERLEVPLPQQIVNTVLEPVVILDEVLELSVKARQRLTPRLGDIVDVLPALARCGCKLVDGKDLIAPSAKVKRQWSQDIQTDLV